MRSGYCASEERYRGWVRLLACGIVVTSVLLGVECGGVGVASATPAARPLPRDGSNAGRFTANDDPTIVDGHPVPADSWSGDDSNNVVFVHFSLASPDCTGVHAEVSETEKSVTVDLREGTHPDAVNRMCTMIVVPATLEVTLQSPLAGRTVLSAL
jgi:hypothetical protein